MGVGELANKLFSEVKKRVLLRDISVKYDGLFKAGFRTLTRLSANSLYLFDYDVINGSEDIPRYLAVNTSAVTAIYVADYATFDIKWTAAKVIKWSIRTCGTLMIRLGVAATVVDSDNATRYLSGSGVGAGVMGINEHYFRKGKKEKRNNPQ